MIVHRAFNANIWELGGRVPIFRGSHWWLSAVGNTSGGLWHHATTEGGCEISGQCLGFTCPSVCLSARRFGGASVNMWAPSTGVQKCYKTRCFLKKRNFDFLRIVLTDGKLVLKRVSFLKERNCCRINILRIFSKTSRSPGSCCRRTNLYVTKISKSFSRRNGSETGALSRFPEKYNPSPFI